MLGITPVFEIGDENYFHAQISTTSRKNTNIDNIATHSVFGIGIGFESDIESSLHWHATKMVNENGELHDKFLDGKK